MNLRDLESLVLGNLRRMKARVVMTAMGVIIGTAAVVVLVSLGAGLERQTRESLMSGSGLTELQIIAPVNYVANSGMPGGPGGETGEREVEYQVVDDGMLAEIRALPGVERAIVMEPLMAQATVVYENLVGYPSMLGVDPIELEGMNVEVADGTLALRRGQVVVGARVVETLRDPQTQNAYSAPVAEETSPPPDLLGEILRVTLTRYGEDETVIEETVRMEVVGVLRPSGWRHDFTIYLPLRDVIDYNTWAQGRRRDPGRQGYAQVIVRAVDAKHTLEVEQALQEMGFPAYSERQEVEQANAYFATVQMVLGGIGAIALLVAAFGIANTMMMSIYERTREVGLMKAVGATNRDVMTVFLAEAGGIGLMGGVGGVVLGFVVNGIINLIAGAVAAERVAAGAVAGSSTAIAYLPLWLPPFAVGFAILVGVASGAYPASRAAALDPIRALKYE